MTFSLKFSLIALALMFTSAFADLHTVNVNRADAERIAEVLDGVGLKRAEAIVAYRASHGEFQMPADLVNVKGIGTDTVERNADKIRVGD